MLHNIRDVAKLADVSIATVSRFLNHPENVGKNAQKKIQSVIEKYGYVPNALVKGVFSNEIDVIGLMIPNVADSYFNYMAKQIETLAYNYGYSIVLCNTDDQLEKEHRHIEMLQRFRVSGIIAIRPHHLELYHNLICPIVTFENAISSSILNVVSNDYEAGQLAFRHLFDQGARRFLMIKGPSFLTASEKRSRGFADAAREMGCDATVCELSTDYSFNMGNSFLDPHLLGKDIDGIFAFSDMIATVALNWLQAHNRRVPEDVRLIGFDNVDIAMLTNPGLTTFDQPCDVICKTLVDSLISIIKSGNSQGGEIIVKSTLVLRGTA